MPSGSKKEDYTDIEQYERQLHHSREWKKRNKDRVKKYNRTYRRKTQRDGSEQHNQVPHSA